MVRAHLTTLMSGMIATCAWVSSGCAPECVDDFDCPRADDGTYTDCVEGACVPLETVPSENTCTADTDCDFDDGAGGCVDGYCVRRPTHQMIRGPFLYLAQCSTLVFEGEAAAATDVTGDHTVSFSLVDGAAELLVRVDGVEVADAAALTSPDDASCTGVWSAASQSAVLDQCNLAFGGTPRGCDVVLVSQARQERPCDVGTCPGGADCAALLEQDQYGTCDCPEPFCGELDFSRPDAGAPDASGPDAGGDDAGTVDGGGA